MRTASIAPSTEVTRSGSSGKLALLALAVSAFGIGTTEFVPVGLLQAISDDLNIGITIAGLLISGYAIGVAAGAPILTALTNRVPRKTLLMSLMVVFMIGNAAAALSSSFGALLIARFVTAFSHGVFFSIGSTIAVQLVPKEKQASAIALMFTGLTVATVTGVPLGTYIGQTFGWRATFWGVAALGAVGFAASARLIPSDLKQAPPSRFSDMFRIAGNGRLLMGFAITALGYGGTFVAFTYLTPILQDVLKLNPHTVGIILLAYGVAVAIGNEIGGRWANRDPLRALLAMFVLQSVVLVAMSFMIPYRTAGLIAIALMGLFAFMNVPGLQLYIVKLAERYVPSAVDVASALNIAAFNLGIAIGSITGGLVVDHMGLKHTAWVGGAIVALAVVLTSVSYRLER